jgi:hypothetical protein
VTNKRFELIALAGWDKVGIQPPVMANIRENARPGVVLFTLLASGCLSTDVPVSFESVAPEERSNQTEVSSLLPTSGAANSVRMEEQLGPVDFAAPTEPVVDAPVASPMGNANMGGAPGATEGEDNTAPFDACVASGLLLCDTFEDATSGEFPNGEQWLPELPGCGTHVVDETAGESFSGSKALRADTGGYPECMLHADLQGATDVFVRTFVRLGSEPDLLAQYFSLLEWGPLQSQDEPEVRIGLRPIGGGGLCPESPGLDVSVSGLAGGSATDCTGFGFEAERWYCVQAHLKRADGLLSVSLAVDGETLLEKDYPTLTGPWKDSSLFFKLGRAAYGQNALGSLWHDDVAVGREPLPCEP